MPRIGAVAPALALVLWTTPGPCQKTSPKPDPYTRGEEDALRKAGYVSLGPFAFGAEHDTKQIEHVIAADGGVLWVETAHFKIGSSLAEYRISRDKIEKKKIRAELTRLAKFLPRVKPKTTRLDRWLRLHMFARRAEDLYAEFSKQLGVTDASFPASPTAPVSGAYMGRGPYLGERGKFTVLLFSKGSTLGHYCRTFLNAESKTAHRHYMAKSGSMFFGTAIEYANGHYRTDTGMHCELAYNLGHHFVNAYKSFSHQVPSWLREGVGHWLTRQIDPKFVRIGNKMTYGIDPKKAWDWEPRVRARAKFDSFIPAEELLRVTSTRQLTVIEHMMAWSRIEYLMTREGAFRRFLDLMKGVIPAAGKTPTTQEVLDRQDEALRAALDVDMAGFDRAWKAHVLKTYSSKPTKR